MLDNDKLTYEKAEILSVLKAINFILVSLHRIGSCCNSIDRSTYENWTTEFIDGNDVTSLLADARKVLSSQFCNDLGDDDMSDLERIMDGIEYWEKPKK